MHTESTLAELVDEHTLRQKRNIVGGVVVAVAHSLVKVTVQRKTVYDGAAKAHAVVDVQEQHVCEPQF